MRILILAFGIFTLVSCRMAPPTRVHETDNRDFSILVDKTSQPVELNDKLTVLDARSDFDYGLNRVSDSYPFHWQDLAENRDSGEPAKDLHRVALRLSLLGLTPEKPVLVVGYGQAGAGEDGRLAWSLLYFGFRDVQVSAVENFRKAMTQRPSPSPKNAAVWQPDVRKNLIATEAEFKGWANPAARLKHKVFIVDVRSAKEYLHSHYPDIQALNIEWKEFYTEKGRPSRAIKKKLLEFGVGLNDRIILVSNRGVRSGAAAYALLALGFTHVRNFVGGWHSMM